MEVCIVGPKRAGKSTLFKLLTERGDKLGRDVQTRKGNGDAVKAIGVLNNDIKLIDTKSHEPYARDTIIPDCDGCIVVIAANRPTTTRVSDATYRAPLKYVCEWYLDQCQRENVNAVLLINKLDLLADTVKHCDQLNNISVLLNELLGKYPCLIYIALVSLHEMPSANAVQKSCAPFFNLNPYDD